MTHSRRELWLQERKTLITSTDAAKIAGVSPFGGAVDVYLEKLGLVPEIAVDPRRQSQLEAGKRFEQAILQWFADDQIVPITLTDGYTVVKSPTHSRIGATLDARRMDFEPNPPVDAKNLNPWSQGWGEPGTDEIPAYYAAQLVFQMHVTGADFADLAVVFGGQRLAVYRLHRDAALEKDLVDKCQHFYEHHILGEVPPAPDGSTSYSEMLKRLIAQQTEREIKATPELHQSALNLHGIRSQIKTLEGEKEYIEQLMKIAIGEAKSLIGDGWKANWSAVADTNGVDWEFVAQHQKQVIEFLRPLATQSAPDIEVVEFSELVKRATKVMKKGSRRFTFNFKDSAQ